MLKRPSSRRKTKNAEIQLNLIPILDALVTLIAFLLFTMSFLSIVSIESPLPQASTKELEEKLKEKPLQLTLTLREKEAEIWSPFERIKAIKVPLAADGQPDVKGIHDALISVKQKFPTENRLIVVPYAGSTYDTLISVLDSSRTIDASDPPIFVKNEKTGNDEAVKSLFPEVIFGNLLGDS